MFNRPEITAEWTVHAQVTITHPSRVGEDLQGETHGESENSTTASNDDGNVRVIYSWHGHSGDDATTTTVINPEGYGFNRGGLTFTAIPPAKCQPMSDSGYISEKPMSTKTGRAIQPYERRCRSTCSITLASPYASNVEPTPCRRATSLKYPQSPISGDPYDIVPRRAHTFTTHFCTELPERKTEIRDAASQTTPVVTENETEDEKDSTAARRRLRMYGRRRHETDSAAILGARNSRTPARRLSRSPASKLLASPPTSDTPTQTPIKINGQPTGMTAPVSNSKTSEGGTSSSDSRKPRTVHIDVYCTGSEPEDEENQEAEDSSNSENEDTLSASSPQTVFESEQVRVRHKRMPDASELPKALLLRRIGLQPSPSSGYPSLASSTSTVARGISASTMSSLMNSESRIGYESSATSWKDTTTSDMESLMNTNAPNSRALSMAPSIDSFEYEDSLDRERIQALDKLLWIEGKTWKSPEFERRLLLRNKLKSLDSEDSIDDEDEETNSWIFSKTDEDSPSSIINKHEGIRKSRSKNIFEKSAKETRESEVKIDNLNTAPFTHLATKPSNKGLNNMDTISEAITNTDIAPKNICENKDLEMNPTEPAKEKDLKKAITDANKEFTHRLTIGPSGFIQEENQESAVPVKESSRATSPFANTIPGYITGHLERARRFGNVVGTLRKPGHHIGPSKNPDCTCEHCRRYFEMFRNTGGARGRTMSTGSVQMQRGFWRKRNSSEEPEGFGWTDL